MTTRSMATVRRATMMATFKYIVKLILLLIFLQYNFYRQRLLPSGERMPRGSGRDAGELSRGRRGFFSGVL
jgi:hypothetical protein